jgi:hypothetical protein
LTGLTYLELPGLGGVGYANGLAHVPFKGSYPLMQFDVADDYFLNFFSRGSWNLLWGLLLMSLPLLFLPGSRTLRRPLISFYLVFATTQLAIFGFSEQGRWAEDSTAINRLPLHFAPALVLCMMLPVIRLGRRNRANAEKRPTTGPAGGTAVKLLPPLLALAITAAGLLAYVYSTLPDAPGTPRLFKPDAMRFVVGNGKVEHGTGRVSTYTDNIAVISSGSILVAADSLSLLRVHTGGDNENTAGFFWRRRGDSENVESLSLPGGGMRYIDLSAAPMWEGKITEVGLVFYRDENRSTEFGQLALLPQTIGSSLRTLWGHWSQQEPWTQASAHWIAGGSRTPIVPLPLIVLAWLLVLLFIYWLLAGRSSRNLSLMLAGCLFAWMLLDSRWTANRLVQASATVASSPPADSPSHINISGDQKIAELIHSAKAVMPEQAAKILIFSADQKMRFQMLRAKYHLLPHAAFVHEGGISSIPKKPVNYVLMIKPVFLDPGDTMPDTVETANFLHKQLGQRYKLITDNEIGMLFQASASNR